MTSKSNKSKAQTAATQAPVQEVATQAPVQEVVAPVQEVVAPAPVKKGKKVAAAPAPAPAAAPATPAPAATPAPVAAQEGGKRKRKAAETAVPAAEAPAAEAPAAEVPAAEAKPSKRRARATPVAEAEQVAEVEQVAEEGEQTNGRHLRSFKVRLPNKEEYEGRFTGLTPYQAANKALSKYFRETENPQAEVTFSICESTRKSKKSVYTYVGRRVQLEVPVRYTIDNGREIVKNFKNSLKKVKKLQAEPVVAAQVQA